MGHNHQQSSAVGVTIVAIVIALGLICFLGVVLLAGFLWFGLRSSAPSPPVMVSAAPLPAPATTPYAPVYSDPSLPPPVYAPYGTVPTNAVPAVKPVTVFCDAKGELLMDGESIGLEELVASLEGNLETVMVTLKIHPSLAYGRVADIQACLQQAGHLVNCQVDRDDPATVQE